MATFKDTLKKWFYTSGTRKIAAGRRICLLDANGNPIGSDTIENIRKLAFVDSDKYVDMGLPSGTLWAKCNLGATSETGYGWYFSWGNPDAHPQGAGYNFDQTTYDATPAASIDGNLTMAQDAASMILGQNWRMPSKEQFGELFDSTYTTNVWVTNYQGVSGLNGRLVTSNVNGNTLFFPAAGYYNGTSYGLEGTNGLYWSLTYYSRSIAKLFYFGNVTANPNDQDKRYYGSSIRPVINN